ncbi:recombinase family protein [Peribacillus saganii]|uniref:Recombinase family protein n=1 Tax=Peribacillus saganii TaxID=2303992 RepID=A0A372LUF6_9BACI|nr:recombinase family protein [Peribacillus saganii]RFU71442.1 recombinase family protein [Peribacillus saganii]
MVLKYGEIDSRDIAIYCRVSTDEQAREGLSLEEQQHRLESYCQAMGWKNEIRYFIDEGFSAKNLERPKLTSLLQEVRDNNISKVIVTKLDRLSRRLLNLLELIEIFQNQEVSFISISESFDTNTPSGRLTLQVLGAVAEFERERIRERVVDNMFHAANKGKWLTSAPYGYELVKKELHIKPETAKVVKRIYDMYLHERKGFLTIAKALNEEGISSPTGKEWWNRTIKLILSNPAYKGTTVWNRIEGSQKKRPKKDMEEWVIQEGTHEAIIEPKVWDLVQEKLESKSLPSRAHSSPHLLSGILKCPKCGSGMSVSTSGSRTNPYKAYRCSTYKNKGTCTGKQYRMEEMHDLFKKGLEELFFDLPVEDFTIKPIKVTKQSLSTNNQKLHTGKKRYERKVEAYTAGLISLEELKKEKERLDILTNVLSIEDSPQKGIREIEEEIKTLIQTVLQAIDTLPTKTVKTFLNEIFEKIVPTEDQKLLFVFRVFKQDAHNS